MYRILIFGGTTEGRLLAKRLSNYNLDITVSVATEAGREALENNKNINCIVNRLDVDEMVSLIEGYSMVVDATHPYASEVTNNIQIASNRLNTPHIRLLREETEEDSSIYVKDAVEAARYLSSVEGNILLATGSKDLHILKEIKGYINRVYARVLPTIESIEKCYETGLGMKNIIAMRGPFSIDTNISLLKEIDAKYMLTKDSGDIGGFREKVYAAELLGVKVVVIGRPLSEAGYSLEDVEKIILEMFNINYKRYFPVFIDIENKRVKVFGAGEIARRRIDSLLNFNPNIEVISPEAVSDIEKLSDMDGLKLTKRCYEKGDCMNADIVIALTNNREVNHSIYEECKRLNIPCNIGDKKEECSFYFPGIALQGNVVVGVTSSGVDHKAAMKVTQKIRDLLK